MDNHDPVYKFQLRQRVRLARSRFPGRSGFVDHEFEVVRLMPADENGEVSYRVKSANSELAVREHEISA